MLRRSRPARRSAVEWTVRGFLTVVAAGIGWASVAHTLGYALRTRNAELAYRLSPGDGRVGAALARALSGIDATSADRAAADRLAAKALRREPTAVAAASTLGLNAQARGDTAAARRFFAYSQSLSRRDLQTQIWAIEDSVTRGDVSGALHHYDVALRTSRRAPDLLYPVLSSAIAEPSVRTALVRLLANRPGWGGFFVDYVAGNGPYPIATAKLLFALRRAGVPIPESANATMVGNLIGRGHPEAAWSYYAATHEGADRRQSRDADFSAQPTVPSPFDWTIIERDGVVASIQRSGRAGLLDFSAPAGVGGLVVQQTQLLPPGGYRIIGHSVGVNQPVEASPYWALTCADGRELGRVIVPASAQAGGVFAGQFTVPAACPVQTLALMARPSDAVGGLSGRIDHVQLAPAR